MKVLVLKIEVCIITEHLNIKKYQEFKNMVFEFIKNF